MDLIKRIKEILFNPSNFFLKLKEKNVQNALIFYVILLAFNVVLGYLFTLAFGLSYLKWVYGLFNLNLPLPQYNVLSLLPAIIIGYIFSVALSFVISGILFLWLYLFKARKGYEKTYQLYVYSETPNLLLKWLPFLGFLSWIYSFVLLIIGTKRIYNFSTTKAVLIYLIPLILIIILILFLVVGSILSLRNTNAFSLF